MNTSEVYQQKRLRPERSDLIDKALKVMTQDAKITKTWISHIVG